ncbi:Transposase DDE domain protein [Dehalobacter sp. DCA]|uniref:IS4 family transposase n=1 Tax=Dehalobacter sp. DCA TaxID=1147129 RepID=UPI00028A5732|nr:transposase [Dehalobacter sp. DCA]AFV03727.1 Transposase DDE domain protein [Dehalobacter sp. DCA]
MRKPVKEIENVLQNHGYSINNIICEVMKTFKLKTLCRKVGFLKQDGYSSAEILSLMLMLPLMLLKSVHALYKSDFQKVTTMKKDSIYRLKNNEKMPWRALLIGISKQFQRLVNPTNEVDEKSAFILDDTTLAKTGRRIEQMTQVFDHVAGKKGSKLGFKNLTLGFFDGKSLTPIDFTLQVEKPLKKARHRKERFKKQRDPKSAGAKRIRECHVSKISNGLDMIKRAVKQGFKAKYVLVDSWFSSYEFIQTIRGLDKKSMHLVCGVRQDTRKYRYKETSLNASQLKSVLKSEGNEKRCRKRNIRYFEVLVDYEGIGQIKLYFCRFPYQKKFRLFLSTDISLSLLSMLEIYSIRWTIEVFFKEAKQHLKLGTCQSRDFDAQIAHITTCYLLYTLLAYFRRVNAYESLEGLFAEIKDELIEKNVAERLWELFDDLLQVVITSIAKSGLVDILEFRNSSEYEHLKELFVEFFS